MSLKYRRSILFDQPQQTTAKLALETIVFDFKERLRMNLRTTSETERTEPERLTAGQAKCIEGLQAKLKSISFHTLYKQYHKNNLCDEKATLDPEKLKMFQKGKYYRCSQRPKEEEVLGRAQSRKRELKQYFERHPEEQSQNATENREKRKAFTANNRVRMVHSTKKF